MFFNGLIKFKEMEKTIYTIPEAARICMVARQTMWRWVKSGSVPAHQTPGGVYRIRAKELKSFIKNKMTYLPLAEKLNQKKILIVDDDFAIRKLLSTLLMQKGYLTATAQDGFEAGRKVGEFKPDLMILDLFMPGMDGFEVCERIKSNPKTAHIKIAIHTGNHTPKNQDRIIKAGADEYLIKPAEKQALFQVAAKLIG